MKKIVLLLLCCLLATLTACGTAAPIQPADTTGTPAPAPVATPTPTPAPPEYSIAVLAGDTAALGYAAMRSALQEEADFLAQELGIVIRVNERNGAGDPATQMQQAQTIFAAKPGAVIMTLADPNAASKYTALSQKSGVPLLFMGTEPAVNLYETFMQEANALFVGGLPRNAGERQGMLLQAAYEKRPEIDRNEDGVLQYIMLMGTPHDADAIARTHYSVEAAIFAGVEMKQLGKTYVCNWNADVAENCMNAALSNEDFGGSIEVVIANTDEMALAALKSLQHAGYNTDGNAPHIALIGAGGTPDAISAIQNSLMDGTVSLDHSAVGSAAVRFAVNSAMGKDWLWETDYQLYEDGYSVRIPYVSVS